MWSGSFGGEGSLGPVLRVGCAITRKVVVVVSVLSVFGVLGVLMVFTLLAVLIVLIVLARSVCGQTSCSCASCDVFTCVVVSLGRRVRTWLSRD